jgi:HEAT repeat protein
LLVLVLTVPVPTFTFAQSDDEVDARSDPAAIAARLSSREPSVRQRAAEHLARLAAVSQKKLIEGYRLQEKDKDVRLALDWALYRIGKSDALYQIVRELDSSRHDQAVSYLSQLDSPSVLNELLKREDNQPKVITGLVESLGQIGDNESLELIKPLRDSYIKGVAAVAEVAVERIEKRLAQGDNPLQKRPRTVGALEKPPQ